jgi:hypothetical protein
MEDYTGIRGKQKRLVPRSDLATRGSCGAAHPILETKTARRRTAAGLEVGMFN